MANCTVLYNFPPNFPVPAVAQGNDAEEAARLLQLLPSVLPAGTGSSSGTQLLSSLLSKGQPVTPANDAAPDLTAMLHGLDQGLRLQALLDARPPQQAQQALTATEMVAEYAASLQRCAVSEAAAANNSTAAQAAAVSHEFITWLSARQQARGVSLQTCTPVDVKVFFESHWLQQHGSLLLSDGKQYAAPSYLSSSISHLSGMFRRLGRTGEYDAQRQVGH